MAASPQRNRKSAGGRTTAKKTTSVEEWKKEAQGVPLDLPSGKTCLVRPVGMQVFMQRGMIPNVLMPLVTEGLKGKQPEFKMDDMDMGKITEMMQLFDDVTVFCVAEPHVWPTPKWTDNEAEEGLCHIREVGQPKPFEERDQGRLYVDEVDDDDKQFIFQFVVGGTRDLESFRKDKESRMAHLRSVPDVEQES